MLQGEVKMKFVPWPRNDRDLLAMRKRVDVSSKTMFFVPFLQRDRKTGASVKVIYHSIQEEGLWTYGILKLAFSEFKKHENSRTCRMPALTKAPTGEVLRPNSCRRKAARRRILHLSSIEGFLDPTNSEKTCS